MSLCVGGRFTQTLTLRYCYLVQPEIYSLFGHLESIARLLPNGRAVKHCCCGPSSFLISNRPLWDFFFSLGLWFSQAVFQRLIRGFLSTIELLGRPPFDLSFSWTQVCWLRNPSRCSFSFRSMICSLAGTSYC